MKLYIFYCTIMFTSHFLILEIYAVRSGDIYSYNKNQLDALISQIYFGLKLYMFRTVPLSIIRSLALNTQQWYISYKFADSLRAESGRNCSSVLTLSANLYDLYLLLCVHFWIPDDGQRNCPKHVEFQSKINLRN